MFQELKRHVMHAPAADSVASALTFRIAFDSMATASGKLPKAGAPASESQQASENPGSGGVMLHSQNRRPELLPLGVGQQ